MQMHGHEYNNIKPGSKCNKLFIEIYLYMVILIVSFLIFFTFKIFYKGNI